MDASLRCPALRAASTVTRLVPAAHGAHARLHSARMPRHAGAAPGTQHARRRKRAVCRSAETGTALVLSEDDARFYRELEGEIEVVGDESAPQNFYDLLNVDEKATPEEIKAAYRALQRVVHPDIAGPSATELAVIMNAGVQLLMDPEMRQVYDAELERFRSQLGSFTNRPVSKWAGPAGEDRGVFVDETTCIGCRQCTYSAPSTFFMEDDWGRARVGTQWGDEEDAIKEAMDLCPVTCIYFVNRRQLALLEYVMKACKREDTAMMARRRSGNIGMAPASENPFTRAEAMMRNRDVAQILEDATRGAGGRRVQDEVLAAAISRAWLALDADVRLKGWPQRMAPAAVPAEAQT